MPRKFLDTLHADVNALALPVALRLLLHNIIDSTVGLDAEIVTETPAALTLTTTYQNLPFTAPVLTDTDDPNYLFPNTTTGKIDVLAPAVGYGVVGLIEMTMEGPNNQEVEVVFALNDTPTNFNMSEILRGPNRAIGILLFATAESIPLSSVSVMARLPTGTANVTLHDLALQLTLRPTYNP